MRDPQRTRQRLLQAAFREVCRSGFQGAGLDTILAATGVTKGALYYHFGSKEALGYAIVEEIVAALPRDKWLRPLQEGKDPIDALIDIVQATSVRPKDCRVVVPWSIWRRRCLLWMNNSASDWRGSSTGWQEGIVTALRRGQSQGPVRRDLVPEETASFLIAMYEGYVLLAKNAQDPKVWNVGIRNIVGWLRTLRVRRQSRRGGRRMSKEHVVRQRQRF